MLGSEISPENITSETVPDILKKLALSQHAVCRTAGVSALGRPIAALEIGSLDAPVLLIGGIGGSERICTAVLVRLAVEAALAHRNRLSVHGIDLHKALSAHGAVVVPLLNPDGEAIARCGIASAPERRRFLSRFPEEELGKWQANANGVDLRIAMEGWQGRTAARPGPEWYSGIFPFSQPECRAVADVCARLRPRALYTLRSGAAEIGWTDGSLAPEGAAFLASTASQLTGCPPAPPERPVVRDALRNWFIRRYGRPALTVSAPDPGYGACWNRVERALHVSLIL